MLLSSYGTWPGSGASSAFLLMLKVEIALQCSNQLRRAADMLVVHGRSRNFLDFLYLMQNQHAWTTVGDAFWITLGRHGNLGAAAVGAAAYGYAAPCLRQQEVYDAYGNLRLATVRVC